jgi:hypothetical protein
MADKLFDLLPQLDVGDPESFIAGTIAILAEYPADVMLAAIDPVRGIPSRTDRPTLRLIKAVCEELYAPIAREEERARARESASQEPKRPPRTAEQQAGIDQQIIEARAALGIPCRGLPRRIGGRIPPDGDRSPHLQADLEARKARNEARRAIEQDSGTE